MNSTALSTTTAGSMSVAVLAPDIAWALAGFPQPVPDAVPIGIAALLIPVIHLLYLWLSRETGVPLEPVVPTATTEKSP